MHDLGHLLHKRVMAPGPSVRVVTYIHDHTAREPIPELADIWPHVQQVVFAQTDLNNQAEKFPDQQLGIARDGQLVMPSPFSQGTDTCTESYYLHHRFFYRFAGAEEYFWSTAVPEQLLAAVYFPARAVAVCLYPGALDRGLIEEFEHLSAAAPKRAGDSAPSKDRAALVVGFGQFMHMLWNHLPALERAVAAGIAPRRPVVVTHQPFGPTEDLFPELAGRTSILSPGEIVEPNRRYPFLAGIGSRRIPRSIRERVRRVARRHAGAATSAERDRFRAAHSPIFWLSIKPPDRTAFNQAEALAAVIEEIAHAHPEAGFVLDGPSRPWDLDTNDSYDPGFRTYLDREIAAGKHIAEEIVARLAPARRAAVSVLCGVPACEEIAWEEAADFYFCHGGTPQHKIGWISEAPGMVYSNSRFIAYYKWMNPLQPPPPTYYLPARLVKDDADSRYSPEKLARKDQNFTLLDPPEIARQILNAYRHSRTEASEMHPEPGLAEAETDKPAADFFNLPEHTGLAIHEVVGLIHRHLKPKTYAEIGAPGSATLGQAACASIAVGEDLVLSAEMVGAKPACSLFRMSADSFFATYNMRHIFNGPVDVALLSGMRLFEVLLRAFRNVERFCKPNSIVLVPGCLPTDAHMARREPSDARFAAFAPDGAAWSGDAWKLPVILKKVRPELRIRAFNATPAGLLAITNLDPESDVLEKQYFSLTEQLRSAYLNQPGAEAFIKAMNVAGTEVFDRYESLSALFWL